MGHPQAKTVHTIGATARRFNIPAWQVRRLFERGLLPEPDRLGPYRVIFEEDMPTVEAALRKAGYLRSEAVPA